MSEERILKEDLEEVRIVSLEEEVKILKAQLKQADDEITNLANIAIDKITGAYILYYKLQSINYTV